MPAEDYAEYLANTLHFTLSSLYYLFDKDAFLTTLHQFYQNQHSTSSLWQIEMLLVFAFGSSILAREAGKSGPAGTAFLARAVEALPDPHRLRQDPIVSIEILCLLALFMQAIDMRRAAYDYIGQALHICLTQGLNRRFDAQRITKQEFDHRSKLWWTVYVIERKLSSLVGVPPALHDEDIALSMPPIDPADKSVVYGLGHQRQLGAKFISACTILTIRPVLFFLLETKLSSRSAPLKLSDAVIGLLRVCVESALQVLKTVEGLRAHNLVDLFLPFDLESMFASAFVLILVGIITPAATEQWDLRKTLTLMDEMSMRGIIIAGPYKKDLQELDDLRQIIKAPQTLYQDPLPQSISHDGGVAASSPGPQLEEDMIWSWMTTGEDELGVLHPDTMQSAIDGLNFDFLNNPSALHIGGHRTVGYLAKKYLTDSANKLFEKVLENPNGWDFSDAATWADVVKRKRPYTATWHYVDARDSPPTQCGLKYPADCSAQGANGCVITAINNQTSLFLSPISSENTTREALMYLMHFIGDLHQPLHVEDAARGGNDIKPVRFGGVHTLNLHSVWDTTIPHKMRNLTGTLSDVQERAAASAWADELFELNAERGVSARSECSDVSTPDKCALQWANESNKWICKYVMKESEEWLEDRDNDLGEEYYDGAKPIVNELIGLAGARLGAWMNAMAVVVLDREAEDQEQVSGDGREDL
ncbi:hypothetical protein IFR05_003937 [Cadophora sp. M221]|nr:hypothetical protein IFR05_003937 [Cadophora sp. M221]